MVFQDTVTNVSLEATTVMPLLEELRALPESERRTFLEDYLERMVSGVLGCEISRVKGRQPLGRLGIDSLKAVELIHRLESAFGITVSLTIFLGEETLADVAGLILRRAANVNGRTLESSYPVVEETKSHVLSHNQLALWMFHQLEPESAAPNVSVLLAVPSNLDEKVLRGAVEELGSRHPMLRTTYEMGNDGPCQLVHPSLPPSWDTTDASQWAWDLFDRRA